MATDGPFKEIKDAISSTLVETTRTAGQIAGEDLAFHRSSNPEITPLLEKQNARLLQLAQNLVRGAATGTKVSAPRLSDADSVDDSWRGIVDVIDNLLEKADACLDEYTGVIKRLAPSQEIQSSKSVAPARQPLPARSYRDQNIPKPQLLFNKIPTNNETTPFKPLLRSKPHAIVPLEESLDLVADEDRTKQYDTQFHLSEKDVAPPLKPIDTQSRYKHPYEAEISQSKYPASAYVKSNPVPYLALDSTKATLVDTPEAVVAMLEELRTAKEIAVDLEHHDNHSYIGLVSLMQISTRDKDWIVDTLKPWREELQMLNEVFADPNILKVLHGSTMDIIWLQRDLGLYVVGLFDTYHASHALGYSKHSLASLLTRFVNFDADKKYQMADWRIRPLPEQMFDYARSDTHFLLYIYDNMRNELIERANSSWPDGNLIDQVLKRSKEETLQRYERPFYDAEHGTGPMGWYTMLARTPALFNGQQLAVFRAVHQWRDSIARQEDESVHHILSKQALFNIARELPPNQDSLIGCSQPISRFMRALASDLLGVIQKAKAAGADGLGLKELMRARHNPELMRVDEASPAIVPAADQAHPLALQIPISKLPIRINHSRFWGSTMDSLVCYDPRPNVQTQHDSLRLALPLPQLTAQIFDDRKPLAAETFDDEPSARAEHQYTKDRKPKEDDVFVVKQLGGARKRKASELQEASAPVVARVDSPAVTMTSESHDNNEMEISLVNEEQLAQAKAERKARRKAQKKLEKEQRKREELLQSKAEGEGEGREEVEAFDYANAPSVLHAKRDNHDRSGPKKAFDPYTKSLDAPKGMRKSKKEIAGKSFTFKH